MAAASNDMESGSGSRFLAGTVTYSANVPWYRSVSRVRPGSVVSSPENPGVPMIGYSTTGRPSSVTPAPSQPRIIGN